MAPKSDYNASENEDDAPVGKYAGTKDGTQVAKLADLVDLVIVATGQKRNVVKPVVESLLTIMAEKISQGDDMVLPPLGRMKFIKRNDDNGVVTLKLRTTEGDAKSSQKDKQALAGDED